jgi:L-glyceraldehyde 3-phosphate reductase
VRQLIDTGVFSLINIVYTLVNPTAVRKAGGLEVDVDWGQVIPYARDHGVGAAIYAPLGGGLLTDNTLAGGPPHPNAGASHGRRGDPNAPISEARQRALNQANAFRFLSKGPQQTLASAAQRFILMEPGVTSILGGFSDMAQMEEAVAAVEAGPLTGEEMRQIDAVWASNFGAEAATA